MQGNKNVLVETSGNITRVTLNRPAKLNSLSRDMIDSLWEVYTALLDRIPAQNVHVVLLKGAGGKALCAGGDVKGVVLDAEKGNWKAGVELFRAENTLDYLISRLADGNMVNGRPCIAQVAIMDGIVMGGGAGLAMHGQFRVATEKSVFSMPETAIGFFPDVGASAFLSRAPCGLGDLLALSGRRLRGRQLLWAGLATHYVPSSHLPALESALMSAFNDSNEQLHGIGSNSEANAGSVSPLSLHTINHILSSFQEPAAAAVAGVAHWLPPGEVIGDMWQSGGPQLTPMAPASPPEDALQEYQQFSALLAVASDHFSSCESVSRLLETLEAEIRACEGDAVASAHGWSLDGPRGKRGHAQHALQPSGGVSTGATGKNQQLKREAARSVLSDLRSMSPMSLRLTLQLFREAAQLSVRQLLVRDFTVCANYTRYGWDFWDGVRSKLVDKLAKTKWLHRAVEDVPDALLQAVCRTPDFCEPLDLNVVDCLFERSKGRSVEQGSASHMSDRMKNSPVRGVMIQAML